MAETKYGKYFIKEPIIKREFAPGFEFFSKKYFGDVNLSVIWSCVAGPLLMEEKPHKHDFDQFLCFYGGNPMDIRDFGAEVELSLGEEGEKHIINTTTIVHISKGLIHCPLYFKRVDRPIIFMNVALIPEYTKELRK